MKKILSGVLLIIILLIIGCGGKENTEAKNMEQIYAESGIPVKILDIAPQTFKLELPFTASITGLRQANASASIGGMIEKVNVKVGDYVNKDQVLIEFPEDSPAGQLTQARSAYNLMKNTYDRMNNLFQLGGISQQELDGIEAEYRVSEANLDAALQMLKVRAPISGYVTSITVRETDGVESETVLATISQTEMMKSKVWVTENEISMIEPGQKAQFEWNNIYLDGEVTAVAMAMDQKYNAFGVDLIFSNKENNCKSGVIGDINITTYINEAAVIIARKNVLTDENGMYVYLANNDQAKKQYITTGKENGSFEVLEGIMSGDKILVEGLNLVSDGAKINVVE